MQSEGLIILGMIFMVTYKLVVLVDILFRQWAKVSGMTREKYIKIQKDE